MWLSGWAFNFPCSVKAFVYITVYENLYRERYTLFSFTRIYVLRLATYEQKSVSVVNCPWLQHRQERKNKRSQSKRLAVGKHLYGQKKDFKKGFRIETGEKMIKRFTRQICGIKQVWKAFWKLFLNENFNESSSADEDCNVNNCSIESDIFPSTNSETSLDFHSIWNLKSPETLIWFSNLKVSTT